MGSFLSKKNVAPLRKRQWKRSQSLAWRTTEVRKNTWKMSTETMFSAPHYQFLRAHSQAVWIHTGCMSFLTEILSALGSHLSTGAITYRQYCAATTQIYSARKNRLSFNYTLPPKDVWMQISCRIIKATHSIQRVLITSLLFPKSKIEPFMSREPTNIADEP